MSAASSGEMRSGRLSSGSAEELAAELAGEMIERWQRGERTLPEELLARHPQLWEHPEAAADLIYEEVSLRQEHGEPLPLEQVLQRFPQWRPQLEVLFDCQRLLGPRPALSRVPLVGEMFGDFLLCAELGRGAQGPVFLARQQSLGGRPVVLKLTPCEAGEHISLARLQHTHIVPLYSVFDEPAHGLRALCMPYFGGTTLAHVLEVLRPLSPALRKGPDVVHILDRVSRRQDSELRIFPSTKEKVAVPASATTQFLARASYSEAICWIGACLADALHYAHERDLVHLDLKPSNILLAADGQPMLLDFHLARAPITLEEPRPSGLGGTTGYLSPEQQAALLAVSLGRTAPRPVDGRSDVYSLGLVLHEALAGHLPDATEPFTQLRQANPEVSVGLGDVLDRCLKSDPGCRYPDMAALATDLRRHLAHRPLAGVRNRSLVERWRKWRRRHPNGIALVGMVGVVLLAVGAVGLGAIEHFTERIGLANAARQDAHAQMEKGDWDGALLTLRRGRLALRGLPFQDSLASKLEREFSAAEHGRASAERAATVRGLHQLADRIRFLLTASDQASNDLIRLAPACQELWAQRDRIVESVGGQSSKAVVRDDLLDLALFWAELQVRLPNPPDDRAGLRALQVLEEAEALCGPSAVLDLERERYGAVRSNRQRPPHTPWDHQALGRALVRAGDLERAAREIDEAVRLEPQGFWPNYYRGLCALRRSRPDDAVAAFGVCIGAAPTTAACFRERARAYAALGRLVEAQRDYNEAVRLDPTLAAGPLGRVLLLQHAQRGLAALAAIPGLLDPLR